MVTSDHTIRRSKGGSVYYKRFFDSIVLGSFSRELSGVEYGGLKGRNSPYFTFLLPEREKRVKSDQRSLTIDNVKRKRSWSKANEAAQTVAKPGLTARKVLLCVWWDWQEYSTMSCFPMAKRSILPSTVNNSTV